MQFSAVDPPRRLLFGPGGTGRVRSAGKALGWPSGPIFHWCSGPGEGNAAFGVWDAQPAYLGHFRHRVVRHGDGDCEFCGTGFQVRRVGLRIFREQNGGDGPTARRASGDAGKAVGRCVWLRRSGGVCAAREAGVVAFVHAETSTGALQDPRPITKAARELDALTIADAVTSLGGVPVSVDEMDIDIAYSCSQKGLSCPPGLAPFTASRRAVERLNARKTPVPEWYLDLRLLGEYFDGHKYHHTASATLFYALHESLRLIHEEGLENRFARHRRAHHALLQGFEELGLRMHVAEGYRIPHLNTPRVPEGVDDLKVRKHLLEQSGIEIAGGFGPLAGKIFRIGLMGPMANEDCVQMFLGKFAEALKASA